MENFKDKVVIVTGAASGIGRATAYAFAKHGAKVVIADRDKIGCEETAVNINKSGGRASFIFTDVSKVPDVQNMVENTIKDYGKLDYACNNAGIAGDMKPLFEYTEDSWDNVINTNLKGVWLCMKYEIEAMIKCGNGGSIVNIGSTFSYTAAPEHYGYVASKHGVIGITKCAALEFIKSGIRVNAVCPDGTETAQIEECRRKNPEMIGPILSKHPINRLANPSEIANAVIWLCGSESSFIVGSVLTVDGGLLI